MVFRGFYQFEFLKITLKIRLKWEMYISFKYNAILRTLRVCIVRKCTVISLYL